MIPIYEAIDFVTVVNSKVGHTKPWVVLANTPEGLKPFVVKLYTTAQIENLNCVTSELICNSLAKEFEFDVPDCAFINIPDDFAFGKLSAQEQIQLNNADPRPKFATFQLSNIQQAIKGLSKRDFKKRIALDTLYAFDNMIRNADQGQQKTNLLVALKTAFLIDHELALNKQNITGINLNDFRIEAKYTNHHLFYPYLRKARGIVKQNYFDEFEQYLYLLNLNKLNPCYNSLSQQGYSTNKTQINNWIENVKEKSTIFANLLKASLQ